MKQVLIALFAITLLGVSVSPSEAGALHNRPATYHPYGYYKHGYMYAYGYVPVRHRDAQKPCLTQGNSRYSVATE